MGHKKVKNGQKGQKKLSSKIVCGKICQLQKNCSHKL